MADVHVETFRPTGLLRIEESVNADTGLPEVEDFVPNGLLGCPLVDEPSSSGHDTPTRFTSVAPSSPFRQNGLLGSRVESGTHNYNLPDSLCLTWRSSRRDHATERPSIALSR